MSFLRDNSKEPAWSASQLQNTYIPIQGRKPRYTDTNSSTGLPNFGMSPWGMVTSVLTQLGISTPIQPTLEWDKVAIVAQNGDDSTGTVGDLTKPYRNISAAVADCTDLDFVIVAPGSYTEAGTVPVILPNISIYCMAGVQVNIQEVTANTLQFGGRHGIFGYGAWTFNTEAVTTIVPTTAASSAIVLEGVLFQYLNCTISWNNFISLHMNVRRIAKASAAALSIDGTFSDANAVIFVDNITDSNDASTYLEVKNISEGSSISITINDSNINRLTLINGYLYTANNPDTSQIALTVYKSTYGGGTTEDESKAPMVVDANCYARKNYEFLDCTTTGPLYKWADTGDGTAEYGCMKFYGRLKPIITVVGAIIDTLIDFRKINQHIVFELDFVDETTAIITAPEAIINAGSESGTQKVTGKLYTSRTLANCPGIVNYGNFVDGAPSSSNATFEYFTLVAPDAANSFRFHGGTDPLPVKSVYTSAPLSGDNGGVTVALDPAIIVDTVNVK